MKTSRSVIRALPLFLVAVGVTYFECHVRGSFSARSISLSFLILQRFIPVLLWAIPMMILARDNKRKTAFLFFAFLLGFCGFAMAS
jgi:hypothetical protein